MPTYEPESMPTYEPESMPTYEPESMPVEDSYEDSNETPTYGSESEDELTPAPTTVEEEEDKEEEEYEEPTPSPVDEAEPATPMDEPYSPQATFAPTVPPPVAPTTAECEDPVGAYNQCGGTDYEGSTCCRIGYECEAVTDCYSEVRLGRAPHRERAGRAYRRVVLSTFLFLKARCDLRLLEG